MRDLGMPEHELREFLEKEIERNAASTTFHWENDETEEAMELLVDAFVKVLVANNKRIEQDWQRSFRDAGMGNL
jgi:hypothetical protein